ncbi:MAG: hypothetical protein DSY89_02790 [Deltaproteobacteria bacterium]|nr:MAG: hypothetical protein DSY89_02790 [Deltaproteobacteria bacterium]
MRLRHIIIYFSLLFLFAHVKIPTGNMGTIPGIGGIGIAHARGGDSGSGGGCSLPAPCIC